MRFVTLAAAALLVAVASCGDDDDDHTVAGPLVGDVAPAVEALEDELGPQDYFEINADRNKVTLWVASEGATLATPHVYAAGELSDAQAPEEAAGETFTADEALTFDADAVLAKVLADFGDRVEQFSIVGGPGDVVRFSALVRSERGGTLEVVLAPDGEVLESGPVG